MLCIHQTANLNQTVPETGISQSREHTGYTAACTQRCCIIYDLVTREPILYGDSVQVGKLVERGESSSWGWVLGNGRQRLRRFLEVGACDGIKFKFSLPRKNVCFKLIPLQNLSILIV